MAQTQIPQNIIPIDTPSLKDVLDIFKKDLLLGLNCHHLATIQSFDETRQTVQATINYKKTYFEPDKTGNYIAVLVDYPVLVDAPIITLGGGNGVITFPIGVGDQCIVFFNDRDMDNWFQGNNSAANPTARLHSFSDALVLVGPISQANLIPNYDTDRASFRTKSGDTSVSINDSEVKLKLSENTLTLTSDKLLVTLGSSGVSFELNTSGKLKINNVSSEFVAALVKLFEDIASGTILGLPLVMPTFGTDLAKLESFKA